MTNFELDRNLSKFYVESRTQEGKEYSRSALLGFRNSIERFINNKRKVSTNNEKPPLSTEQQNLDAKLKINHRTGKENVKHKPIIVQSDLKKIQTSTYLAMDNPNGLLRRTCFIGVEEDVKDKETSARTNIA
jgi:hypothetical protein